MTNICPKCQHKNPDDTLFCGKCGTQFPSLDEANVTQTIEAPKEELTRGSTLANRYEIIEELGKGGMGRVYRVEDTKLKQEVALKLIKPEIAKDKKTIERFRNELKLARNIRHKNVCGMFDLGEEKGSHYITMEYVTGEDLKSFIRRVGQLPLGKAISIAKQICDGLLEAHRLEVIHRDLKPSNVMIDKDGNARIMDFGIARSLEAKGITGAGVLIGTPEYMSPEQVEGKEVDQRSDVYSLGVILYEMVTGRVPFEGDTALTIAVKHKTEEPKDPREFNTQISEDLSRIILRCLEKGKDSRYQSAGEVRSELTNIEKRMPTTERVIPERKPLTSREITVQFSLKKAYVPALVFIAIVVIGIVIWQLFQKKASIPTQYEKPAIAVMYFENNTGDANLDHYRKAISDLVITDLSQSKHFQVVRGDKLYNILKQLNLDDVKSYSSEDLKDVAVQGKASHILQGSYTKAGETFRINYMLHEASTEEIIGSERTEGKGEESIFTMVDEITKKVKASFKLSQQQIDEDIDRDVGTITTNFPEALKFYTEARDYHSTGQYRKSIQSMEKAVAIDPEFAMAYRSLAMSYNNLGLFAERTKYITKAIELSDRLSDREYYQIQGDYYGDSEKTYGKAIEAFNKLLELYPEDYTARVNLGGVYSAIDEYDRAIELLRVAVRPSEGRILIYTNLESYYRAKGMYEEARGLLENYINNVSDHAAIHRDLSNLYIEQGKFDSAINEIDKAFYLDPTNYYNSRRKGDIYLYKGDFTKAEEEYQKLLKLREPVASAWGFQRSCRLGRYRGQFKKAVNLSQQGIDLSKKYGQSFWAGRFRGDLARTYYIFGDFERALTECDAARMAAVEANDFSLQRGTHVIKGLVYLRMGDIDKAQKEADKLKSMSEVSIYKKAIRIFYYLQGMIEQKKNNYSEAIDYFYKAISLSFYGPLNKRADFIDSLALSYYKAGNLENALREYERITTLTTGRLGFGDIYAKSFYMLGNIYEQQGDTAKAIEHYEKFLDLWKDADPGIAEVDDARKRLAGLK